MSRARRFWPILALILLGPSPGQTTETSQTLLADYQSLQEWSFDSRPTSLPEEGVHWQIDVGDWHLADGQIWLQRPTQSGQVTGLVFRGEGRYRIAVPDPLELRQLRRFTGEPEIAVLEGTFDALVVRGVGLPPFLEPPEVLENAGYSPHSLARQRHQRWLALRAFDVDARVIAALGSSDDAYVRVDMKTSEHGWLTFDYDARRAEEIVVEWFNSDFSVLESWLSLDRAADRQESGLPTGQHRQVVEIEHVEVTADLQKFASESQRGAARIRPVDAQIEAEIVLVPLRDGDRIVQFYLHPWGKVESIRNGDSTELQWIRDHLGKRSSAIRKRVHDDSLVVLLDQPLSRDRPLTLRVRYELELSGYAPGRSWYPSVEYPGSGLHDLHTAELTLHQRPRYASRSMGTLVRDDTAEGVHTTSWSVERPVKMLSFVFAKQHHEEILQTAGGTEVAAFSSLGGYITGGRVRQLGADSVLVLDYYEELFDAPVPTPELVVGLVPATHGQAFDGLIHIGDYSTLTDRVAERELFRAHEIAHLWWGHQVGWHGYRDQWLSEGFSQYSAMMYVEAKVENGDRYFEEMLAAFTNELTGSIKSGFSQFSRPDVSLLNKRAADRVGPVAHGRRCLVGEAPTAYRSQSYKRGALTLHSLRMILRARTGSDEAFLAVLRQFLKTNSQGFPSSHDFQTTVETVTGDDWSWFFDTWIYRAEIPTYAWRHTVSADAEGARLELDIDQRGVTAGSVMEVPVLVEYPDGEELMLLAHLNQPSQSFEFTLPAAPKRVTLNPDHAVLARVKKR